MFTQLSELLVAFIVKETNNCYWSERRKKKKQDKEPEDGWSSFSFFRITNFKRIGIGNRNYKMLLEKKKKNAPERHKNISGFILIFFYRYSDFSDFVIWNFKL